MQIPNDLKTHFPHATLLILSDSITAKFFLIGGDAIQELDGISEPREFRQDSEGSFTSYDGSRVGGPDSDIDDAPRQKSFIKKIAGRTADMVRTHATAHLVVVMPAELDHALREELPGDVRGMILHALHKNLMKEDTLSILRRIYTP